uniref:Uncharacterized protein n=1 Tax=Tanacetum cinerariifolium TaxID=118510 RepID=A0A6L2LGZ5_TANCI|nr:hypothetical protein [Tanacetum cinerariifolium]
MLDKKELSLTLDDFRTIFHFLQATNNNHDRFVPPLSFYDMIPFYKNHLGFTMELKTPSSFKTTGLLQPAAWEGIHYSLLYSTSLIPYPRFAKIIIGHYMNNFPEISRRARDKYHNLKDDDLIKNIFNLGKYKDKVGMKILDWIITEAMKQTEHYRMYAEVFGIDVLLIQSSLTESTQGTHRTPSAPRSPTPKVDAAESSVPTRSTMIRLRVPQRKSTCLTPPASVLTEARENVVQVEKHLAYKEIKKMVEGQEHVVDDSSIHRNDEHNIPGTRLEPRSDNESSEVGITDVIIPVNVYDEEEEEDEITDEELQGRYGYLFRHLKARFMPQKSFGTLANHPHDAMAESLPLLQKTKEVMEKMIAKAILQERGNIQAQISSQIQQAIVPQTTCRTPAVRTRDQDDPHDDAHLEEENSAKRKKTSEYKAYVSGESSSGQDNKVNLTVTTISFIEIEKHKMFSIIYEHVHGIIYKNSKKEKRVTRHSEIHKFCDATLKKVLEGLKSYNNDVREFWCIAIAYDPEPLKNNSEKRPLKEYLIKFSMMNGKEPLILDYKAFVESTGLGYAKGKYMSHPSTEEVLGGNYSSTKALGEKDSEGNETPANMEPINLIVVDLSRSGVKYQANETQTIRLRCQSLTEKKGKTSSEVEPDTQIMRRYGEDTQADEGEH